MGGSPEPYFEPDIDAFHSVVMPVLEASCSGASCHTPVPPRPDNAYQMYGAPMFQLAELTDEQRNENYREATQFINWDDPPASDLLRLPALPNQSPEHTTNAFIVGAENYNTVLNWILDAVTRPEPDAGPDGGPDGGMDGGVGGAGGGIINCDTLPEGDVLSGRPAFFQTYRDEIDGVVATYCADADCHGTPAFGGSLYLQILGMGDGCEVQWNFMTIQWFIDPRRPLESPILRKPVEPGHGGREPFLGGTANPDYVRIQNWVISGYVDR